MANKIFGNSHQQVPGMVTYDIESAISDAGSNRSHFVIINQQTLTNNLTPGSNITIEVLDNGVGIPEEELKLVIERFYRARNSGIASGSGLGLSISNEIVKKHNGKLEIVSVVNKGTKVIVTIPKE